MNEPIRVLIVDENDAFRQTTRAWIEGTEGLICVGEAQDGQAAIEQIGMLEPDIVLLGLNTLRLDNAPIVARINERHPHTKVLVLSTCEDQERLVLDAFRNGAHGHLDMGVSQMTEIAAAIRTVSRGGAVLAPGMAGWILSEVTHMQRQSKATIEEADT